MTNINPVKLETSKFKHKKTQNISNKMIYCEQHARTHSSVTIRCILYATNNISLYA